MKKNIYVEVNVHLYINVLENPELAEDIKILKAKRKLNKIMIEAIKERLEKEKEYDLFK
jgi:hypothetical protein